MAVTRERQRGAEARDPRSHDDDVHRPLLAVLIRGRARLRSCTVENHSVGTRLVPERRRFEREPELLGERCQPREHVAEFVHLFGARPLPDGPRQLPHFLGEPGDRRRDAPGSVAVAVRARHQVLERSKLHRPIMAAGSLEPGLPRTSRGHTYLARRLG